MNKLYYLLIFFLVLIVSFLFISIFFGDNNYSTRNELTEENNNLQNKNKDLKKQNEILEFEINNAQSSNDHIENFAREKLNLTYPSEEFITFKEQGKEKKQNEDK
jgi:cell division protein FtsL